MNNNKSKSSQFLFFIMINLMKNITFKEQNTEDSKRPNAAHYKSEKGQALILIVFAIIALIAMTGLVIDGGIAFSDRRAAQNTVDAAAYSAALAKVRGNTISTAAENIIEINGYDISWATINNPPLAGCNGQSGSFAGDDNYIQVILHSKVATTFGRIIGIQELNNCVEAVTFVDPPGNKPLFEGNAIVGLNPTLNRHGSYPCGFDSGNSGAVKWYLKGGGVFSNGCAYAKNFNSVDLDEDAGGNPTECVYTVGPAYNFKCMQDNKGSSAAYSPEDVAKLYPDPPPTCDGTLEGGFVVPSNPTSFTFTDGVYCVSNFDAFRQKDIYLQNATLYITDPSFDVKFAGHGGFAGYAPTSGPYEGFYMIVAMNDNPCERYQSGPQSLEFRGNGTSDIVGTILAPTICIDFRGNSNGYQTRSQVIGYTVSSNGNASLYIDYDSDDNAFYLSPALIQLIQ